MDSEGLFCAFSVIDMDVLPSLQCFFFVFVFFLLLFFVFGFVSILQPARAKRAEILSTKLFFCLLTKLLQSGALASFFLAA